MASNTYNNIIDNKLINGAEYNTVQNKYKISPAEVMQQQC